MKFFPLLFNVFTLFPTATVVIFLIILFDEANFTKISSLSGPPLPDWPFLSVWNAPTENCENKWNVSLNLSSFDIVANKNMSWHGDFMTIFYQNQIGLYPYFDSSGMAVNGGLPQLADFEKHFEKVKLDIAQFIPDPDFKGIAVIDWESWRPVFDRNWDSKGVYRNKSFLLAKQKYPSLPADLTWEIAKIEFEAAARKIMEGTLLLAKNFRPKALWGYYGFPRCYNNGKADWKCSNSTKKFNNQLSWLFDSSSILFPSIYLSDSISYNTEEFVKYQLHEAFRVAQNTRDSAKPVLPYIRFVYSNSEIFLNKEDLLATVGQSAEMATSGVVIWGSTTDCSNKLICSELQSYTDQLLGPLVRNLTQIAIGCSSHYCTSHGRCEFLLCKIQTDNIENGLLESLEDKWKFTSCKCYSGWTGKYCQLKLL